MEQVQHSHFPLIDTWRVDYQKTKPSFEKIELDRSYSTKFEYNCYNDSHAYTRI